MKKIKSYFFIPGNHPKLIEKVSTIDADHIIIDFEDAFDQKQFDQCLDIIEHIDNKQEILIRPKLGNNKEYDTEQLKMFLDIGFFNFVIPKFRDEKDIKIIESIVDNYKYKISFVLLIENANAILRIERILSETKLNVIAIGFGSQDFVNDTGMKYKLEVLNFARYQVSLIGAAFQLEIIDIANMNLKNDKSFIEELRTSRDFGYTAKFIIHPDQLVLLKEFNSKLDLEIQYAQEVLYEYEKQNCPVLFVYKGIVIEKPHIEYYKTQIYRLL